MTTTSVPAATWSSTTSTRAKPGASLSQSRRTVAVGSPSSAAIQLQLAPSPRSRRPTPVIWPRISGANRRPRPLSRRASAARSFRISLSVEPSSQRADSRARRRARQDGLQRGGTLEGQATFFAKDGVSSTTAASYSPTAISPPSIWAGAGSLTRADKNGRLNGGARAIASARPPGDQSDPRACASGRATHAGKDR